MYTHSIHTVYMHTAKQWENVVNSHENSKKKKQQSSIIEEQKKGERDQRENVVNNHEIKIK